MRNFSCVSFTSIQCYATVLWKQVTTERLSVTVIGPRLKD